MHFTYSTFLVLTVPFWVWLVLAPFLITSEILIYQWIVQCFFSCFCFRKELGLFIRVRTVLSNFFSIECFGDNVTNALPFKVLFRSFWVLKSMGLLVLFQYKHCTKLCRSLQTYIFEIYFQRLHILETNLFSMFPLFEQFSEGQFKHTHI